MSEATPHDDDLAHRAATIVESAVAFVRDRSIRPVRYATRVLVVVVFGLLVGIALVAGIVIGLVRLFDADVFAGRVWATDALVGGIFLALGMFLLWRGRGMRRQRG